MRHRLERKLHPRTGYMIIVPGFIALALLALYLVSPNLQAAKNAILGWLMLVGILTLANVFLLWMNRGHTVYWDDTSVSIRQPDADLFMRRFPVATVAYADVRGIKLLSPPRGVPPRFPLVAIETEGQRSGSPLLIDPNYFTPSSLSGFIDELRARVPKLNEPSQAKIIGRLLKVLGR